MFSKYLVLTLVALAPTLLPATTYIQQGSAWGRFGTGFGEGLSKGIEEARIIAQERQLHDQLQQEQRIANEMSYYNTVVFQLSCESAHPELTLSQELAKPFTHKSYIKMSDSRMMGCVFKRKFNRILSDGTLVEWLWSLDISNETQKSSFSSGRMEYPKARLKIELLDANNFVVSSCIFYSDLFLKRGEGTVLQGKWVIPYDQVSHVSSYQISLECL